jgi:hypothetical protein
MKLMKKALKVIALFGVGLTIGTLIRKHVCKKYAYNTIEISDCRDMIPQ